MGRHFNAIGNGLEAISVLGRIENQFHGVAAPFHIADAVVEKVFYKR